jgi:uncharacterized membrane protein
MAVGAAAAAITLTVIVVVLGPAISAIPISYLRLLVGGLLLVFGVGWLRKVIMRASGLKALHDEDKIYAEKLAAARAASTEKRPLVGDWYAFTLSFKGVLLEGLEVVFIVLTFGTNQHNVPLAALAAGCAVLIIAGVGDRCAKSFGTGSGEHHEVRRRRHADRVRDLLGRRRGRRGLARI